MTVKLQQIHDVDGVLLHSGQAKTRRGFIEDLVKHGKSLDRANLADMDLSGLDLTRIRARDACLDGVDLRGARIKEADFTGSSFLSTPSNRGDMLRPARLDGCSAERAVFDHCDLSGASIRGASITHIKARSTILDGTDFSGSSIGGACFSHARGERTNFSQARLVNADFVCSTLVFPDFRSADLGHNAFGSHDPAKKDAQRHLYAHLPNRTRGSTVIGGTYDKSTVLCDTVPGIRMDARTSRITRAAITAGTMLGLVTALHLSEPLIEVAKNFAGTHGSGDAMGIVAVVGALQLVNHAAGDWAREKSGEILTSLASKVREIMKEADLQGARRIELVCAMTRGRSAAPLRMALASKADEAAARGFWPRFRSFFGRNLGHVIVCDRRHLALALGTMAMHARSAIELRDDITIVRCDGPHACGNEGFPCAMRFMRDGRSTAVWPVAEDGHVTACYGRNGVFEGCRTEDGKEIDPVEAGLPDVAMGRLPAVLALEAAVLSDHGLADFDYERETHTLRDGRDGSILVYRRSDGVLSNPSRDQPAIIRADGTTIRMVNGAVKDDPEPEVAPGPSPR